MSKRKLLLADDSVTIQKVVNLTFADEGIEVISVGDGDSAMKQILENSPDLVMADVNMPGLNGYEICDKLRHSERFSRIPIILLVGSFEPFDEAEAKRVGADDYLTKPFQSIRQLVNKVTVLLNSSRAGNTSEPSGAALPAEAPESGAMERPSGANGDIGYAMPPVASANPPAAPVVHQNFPIAAFDKEDPAPLSDTLEGEKLGNHLEDDEMISTNQIAPESLVKGAASGMPIYEGTSDGEVEPAPDVDSIPSNGAYQEAPFQDAEKLERVLDLPSDEENISISEEERREEEFNRYLAGVKSNGAEAVPAANITSDYAIVGNDFDDQPAVYQQGRPSSELMPLPEAASILELDEVNPLEIAPREEDFILNFDDDGSELDLIGGDLALQPAASIPQAEKSADDNFIEPALEKEYAETEASADGAEAEETIATEAAPDSEELEIHEAAEEEPVPTYEMEKVSPAMEYTDLSEGLGVSAERHELAAVMPPVAAGVPSLDELKEEALAEVKKEQPELTNDLIDAIVNRVIERLSDKVIREIAAEVVPAHTELIVKKLVQEKLENS